MDRVFGIAAATDTLLTIAHYCFDVTWLPLGHGPLQQLGVCFGIAHVIVELTRRR